MIYNNNDNIYSNNNNDDDDGMIEKCMWCSGLVVSSCFIIFVGFHAYMFIYKFYDFIVGNLAFICVSLLL